VTTVYVYDAFGNLAAEYSSQAGTSPCGTSTCYVSWDHLGSTRMLTDANGDSTVQRYDYLPFGGELLATTNGRTTAMGYFSSPDPTATKFTGQYRDYETTNDWFLARTFGPGQDAFRAWTRVTREQTRPIRRLGTHTRMSATIRCRIPILRVNAGGAL